ncbi:hypothetical protein GALL_251830 [mine drainage metagenome]|uniref:Tetratricopeptide repeat protein n=1 Tax=mine drainage metagenome TaxID=410659 RepID=A0A1J5RA06_9ZZZZ
MTFLHKHYLLKSFLSAAVLLPAIIDFAQPNTTVNLDKSKPKQYEERKLTSEKTGDTKFSVTKKFFQNTFTHYNYYFNANARLGEVINNAKALNKDDYTKLLSFYNYSLDATAKEKQLLDSVIYKCNAGILLHDLRNDWVDDLYMLLGKAFLLRKNFDSAEQVFQYINYVYAPKDDGYDILLGSNTSNTNGVFTIATKEQKDLIHKITNKPPARNESFIWQARNYIEQNKIAEATGLIAILKTDPFFPQRLQTDLHEIIAYSFYKQQMYDSAALHLQQALNNAADVAERSRWEFLCGQLFQLSQKNDAAIAMYEKAMKHTIDPFMDVYARLNIVKLSAASKKENALQSHLNELYKLAKRDKFENYRDIIYYAAALLQEEENKTAAAKNDLLKSIRFNVDNPQQKTKSFLLLADINYNEQSFVNASTLYDSVKTNLLTAPEKDKVELRKPALKIISKNITNIHLQDSLLHLATLTDAERIAAVKKIYKQIRKEQGLKEIDDGSFGGSSGLLNSTATDLFSSGGSADFYFLNAGLKAQGNRDFKMQWGNRPNADNWRRLSAVNRFVSQPNNRNLLSVDVDRSANDVLKPNTAKDITPQGLLLNIPLTPKKVADAEQSIAKSLFENGETFQNKLEEYSFAVSTYETLLKRFTDYTTIEQTLFNLALCYKELGNNVAFDSIKNVLNKKFPTGSSTFKINGGEFLNKNDSTVVVGSSTKELITKEYEDIYNLFIEGRFQDAIAEKQKADQLFGKKYWTPQLLFIEAIYYVKQKQDSIAINRLQELVNNFTKTALADRAKTMIDVLKRRKEIENYLTNLQIEKNTDSVTKRVDLYAANAVTAPPKESMKKDSVAKVAAKEIKVQNVNPVVQAPVISDKTFSFIPADAHFVMIIFDKVDRVFTSESRNAFNRYNMENYYNKKIDLSPVNIDARYDLLLMGPFTNAAEAVAYADNVAANAKSRIIPWLTKDKYSFSIISNNNLTLLKETKDVGAYTKFIHNIFPDKF